MRDFDRSKALFEDAQHYLVGGVDSPVRAFKAVGGTTLFIKRGIGSKIYDADGNEFIDYVSSWGPLILGHSHPKIVNAAKQAVEQGSSFGAPTELETRLAQMISEAMPSIELLRFVNSGTEATMSAIRLARAFTGRNKIVKFAGCYHGHSDGLLARAGSGLATLGIPSSPGVPESWAADTLVAPYNNSEAVEILLRKFNSQVAAVIVEPVAGNMGLVLPQPGFLEQLRKLTQDNGVLLIFDEVITGFRVSYNGAQGICGIKPDLTCLGKIIGGGFPVGAYGGRKDIMQMLAPLGPVYQAGTLAGNPVVMTVGIETLTIMKQFGFYEQLEKMSDRLIKGITQAASKAGITIKPHHLSSMFTIFFTNAEIVDFEGALSADIERYAKFFHQMLIQGIYLPPSQFETAFISAAHSNGDIEDTIRAATVAFNSL